MPCSWKTYLKNFVKLNVSRVTGFPEFPNSGHGFWSATPHHTFVGDVEHRCTHRGEASRVGDAGRCYEEGGEPVGATSRALLLLARSRCSLAPSSSAVRDPASVSSPNAAWHGGPILLHGARLRPVSGRGD
jgi:hypothetical protein